MPSYEVILKRDYQHFYKAWDECKQPLYINSRYYIEQQQKPLRVRIGCEFTIYKIKAIHDDMTIFLYDDEGDDISAIVGDTHDCNLYGPNACFKHCTIYHQTKQENHDDRLTVLSTIMSIYDYTNISYPTSLEDVKIFEINNELCISF